MGTSHEHFVKYPRTPHLFGSRGTDDDKHMGEAESLRFIADPSLIVEESCCGPRPRLPSMPRSLLSQRWIDLFTDYQARAGIVYIEPPWTTLLAQNRNRLQVVPDRVVVNLALKTEPPTWAKCHTHRISDGTTDE